MLNRQLTLRVQLSIWLLAQETRLEEIKKVDRLVPNKISKSGIRYKIRQQHYSSRKESTKPN